MTLLGVWSFRSQDLRCKWLIRNLNPRTLPDPVVWLSLKRLPSIWNRIAHPSVEAICFFFLFLVRKNGGSPRANSNNREVQCRKLLHAMDKGEIFNNYTAQLLLKTAPHKSYEYGLNKNLSIKDWANFISSEISVRNQGNLGLQTSYGNWSEGSLRLHMPYGNSSCYIFFWCCSSCCC